MRSIERRIEALERRKQGIECLPVVHIYSVNPDLSATYRKTVFHVDFPEELKQGIIDEETRKHRTPD